MAIRGYTMKEPILRQCFGFYVCDFLTRRCMIGVRLGTMSTHLSVTFRFPRPYPHVQVRLHGREFGNQAF